MGALLIVAILVIGTVSTVFILQGSQTAVAPTVPTVEPTSANGAGLDQLVTQGDQAAAKGDWASATSRYRAYLSQDTTNAEVHFKLGKAYLNTQPPSYLDGLSQLQQAVGINPNGSFAPEANSLINQYKDKVPSPAAITGTISIGDVLPTAGISGTTSITGTLPVTSTVAPTKAP